MRKIFLLVIGFFLFISGKAQENVSNKKVKLSKEQLKDKIKGGWAGQTIGVTFGWKPEFQYQGSFIQDYKKLPWGDDYVNKAMTEFPGLYDDIYMDLTFLDVIEKKGLDATADDFGDALAATDFPLWHANQAARYNLQQGMSASQSGHWLNNPHADDIDFLIASDFIGLMSPGLPNTASVISDKIGHTLTSGDGWYGGVFISNMYAIAFVSNDRSYIINQALKAVPQKSQFHQTISDVIKWHKRYPKDWKKTWFEIQRKWAEDVGCPSMVFHSLNIDAKLNAAYVVLGLLYGQGNFTKTLEITARAGQDSDSNAAPAAGILGTIYGYDRIPSYWLDPLKKAEHRSFKSVDYSLEKTYRVGYKHALMNIKGNGGEVTENTVEIPFKDPQAVRYEQNFTDHFPKEEVAFSESIEDTVTFDFEGNGFVLKGYVHESENNTSEHTLEAALYVDGQKVETASFPTKIANRRLELFWEYQLQKGTHKVKVEILNPHPDCKLVPTSYIVYDNEPTIGIRRESELNNQ